MTEPMPLWIRVKQATKQARDDAGGDKVLAAVATRMTHSSRFSEYSSLNQINRVVPLDAAIEVDKHSLSMGRPPRFIALAARELGLVIAAPPASGAVECSVTTLCSIVREHAEAVAAISEALADGKITTDEAMTLRVKLADAQSVLAAFDGQLAKIESGDASCS
jgi:hypothetical protein